MKAMRDRARRRWLAASLAWGNEGGSMAQGGSVTTAYKCTVQAYKLETEATSRLRTDCATVPDAVERLERGETVTVAGSDMMQLRSRLAGHGVG